MSDMQNDSVNPKQFERLVKQGVIGYVEQHFKRPLHQAIDLTLIPGDLVDDGNEYEQWQHTFFSPIAPLAAYVPTYPVPGNHEYNSPNYFKYFTLPTNGSSRYLEHWYWVDQSNVRVISLDTNKTSTATNMSNYRIEEQLAWLDKVLTQTCQQKHIDFVFAQMHHPHKSELWGQGELDYSGKIVAKLEQFSTACNKPSIHFFGHTHGYSRGVSRDHHHAMVNVASAGGNLDYFGEGDYIQTDYTEYSVSQAEYGFVLVDVNAGNDPWFELKRISLGSQYKPLNNELRDSLKVRKNNTPPKRPVILMTSSKSILPSSNTVVASEFSDVDGDLFGAAHWQVSTSCNDFTNPLVDHWYQHQNIYNGQDTRAGLAHNRFDFSGLDISSRYCLRVRYRDRSLAWSEWSIPQPLPPMKAL